MSYDSQGIHDIQCILSSRSALQLHWVDGICQNCAPSIYQNLPGMCLVSECTKIDNMFHTICRHLALCTLPHIFPFLILAENCLTSEFFKTNRIFDAQLLSQTNEWMNRQLYECMNGWMNHWMVMDQFDHRTKEKVQMRWFEKPWINELVIESITKGSSRDATASRNLWTSLIQILITHQLKRTLPLITLCGSHDTHYTQCKWYRTTCDILSVSIYSQNSHRTCPW